MVTLSCKLYSGYYYSLSMVFYLLCHQYFWKNLNLAEMLWLVWAWKQDGTLKVLLLCFHGYGEDCFVLCWEWRWHAYKTKFHDDFSCKLRMLDHQTHSHLSNRHSNLTSSSSSYPIDCVYVCAGRCLFWLCFGPLLYNGLWAPVWRNSS